MKSYICSHDTFLWLKTVKNGVLQEWGFKFCLRFRRHFLGVSNLVIGGFSKKKLFNFGFKGVMEKYLFLRVFIFDQKVLPEWRFKFLCATYPLGSCKTHYSLLTLQVHIVDKNASRYCNKDITVILTEAILVTLCQLWKWLCMVRKL